MDEALRKELDELREENQILRDSLVESRAQERDEGSTGFEKTLQEILDMLETTAGQVKTLITPSTEKLTAHLSHQLDENPIPVLLAAFGAGYLFTRRSGQR